MPSPAQLEPSEKLHWESDFTCVISPAVDAFLANYPIAPLPAVLRPTVAVWAERFRRKEQAWCMHPEVREGWLYASPLALPFLLHHAVPGECSEMDWKRLYKQARGFLTRRLANAVTVRDIRALSVAVHNLDGLVAFDEAR